MKKKVIAIATAIVVLATVFLLGLAIGKISEIHNSEPVERKVYIYVTNTPVPTRRPTPTPEPSPKPEPTAEVTPDTMFREAPEFVAENLKVMGLYIGMGIEDAEVLIGDYISKEVYMSEAIGAYHHDCEYDFGAAEYVQDYDEAMDESWVVYAMVDNSDAIGPAGIVIGDRIDNVIEKLGIPMEYFERQQGFMFDGSEYIGSIDYADDGSVEKIQFYIVDTCYGWFTIGFEDGMVDFYSIYEHLN